MIQEKLASYTPRNVNKRQKRAQSKITITIKDLKTKISEPEDEKSTISGQLDGQTKELNDIKQKMKLFSGSTKTPAYKKRCGNFRSIRACKLKKLIH